MTVLTQPASFSLSGNIEKFRISATEEFSFILKKGTEEILSSVYSPGKDHLVTIDIREIVESKLSFLLKDQSEPYVQTSIFADFTAVIDKKEILFRVLRGGVDRLATSAENFVTSNFLTWQPQIKPVTYYTPEFLTYYATVDGNVCVKAYFSQEEGEVTSEIKTVYSVLAGNAYSIPVQYAVIMALFGSRYPSFYDVWVENSSGNRLTYIQRYVADGIKSEQEQWVLFENSLGGIDTFRAYGQSDFTGEHTHNIAEIDEEFSEYRIDTTRSFQKSTGYLDKNKRKWLLDFFPSKVKYIYLGNYLRPIVVTEDNTSYTDKELPSSYTFTYKYADARPYLNLLRTDQLPDELDIDIPDLGSFSIPPRIVEFPSQPLSEGVLIPVQNPYSENWATTTAGAIFAYILNNISENYDGQGGIGHIHPNLELINAISYLDGYLLINGKKIKAGWADQLSPDSPIYKMFIRKDEEDSTNFLLSLLGGTIIKKYAKFGEFITGVDGGFVNEKGDAELNSLTLRDHLSVPEVRFNRMTYFEGYDVISPGGGFLIRDVVDNGDGTYTITPEYEDEEPCGIFLDDIYTGYWYNFNGSISDIKGFGKVQFRVTSVDYDAKTAVLIPKPESGAVPSKNLRLGQTGNFTNKERQIYIIIDTRDGNCCITFFEDANTWDPEPAQVKSWFGKKKGMTVAGINADNYSAVLQNIIMTGLIFQVDEITGQTVRVPLDKGEWVAGKYAYYDRVSHNGALWLCVDDNGTTTEPSDDNPAWLKQVAEGQKGEPGLSIVGGGHWESSKVPYKANTMVTLANCVFISKVETSNPPIRILRVKGGNFLRKKDGGYYLAGKPADWEVNEDWDMLLDGRELKGESITFLGEFATAPANPKNGDSYRNTTDRATYIYQDGRWQLMISDGKDGKDYEYIYTRGNIIDNPPAKPDSQQKDDYIPEGWTDDFVGVDADHQVEWGCKRFKENGVWSEFSTPAVVHRWSKDGADGESITAAGHWESANIPYAKNSTVSFAGGSYLSKVQTSNPPLPLLRVRGGRYLRKKDGGYILSGKRSDKAVNSDWQEMTSGVEPSASYWLDSTVSTINFTSTGTPSPSAFVVTMKQNIGGNVSDTNRFYLVARKYNGSWLAHVGATLNSQISVPATAGYTQFAVRAYKSASDANAWNNNFVAEKGVGVAKDGAIGATGATGAFPRDRGVWASGQTYVWNADYRDKVIYMIGGVYYNFLVKNYGASVTSAPTSANGDSNWEAMQKFVNIATDTLFADGANVAGFMFKNNVLKSHNDEGETLLINGVTGYFKCKNAEITGTITADKGRIGPFSIASGILSSKILYENETNKYVGFNLSAGQIEFYNERTFANIRIGGNTQFVTIEGIKYDAGIDIQSLNAMIGMHIKTPSIPLFVEGGNIFLHPNNDSYVSIRGIVGNWRNISVKASLNNNDDNVMFINRDNIEVTLPPDVPGHTIYFKRMNGGVRLTGGRILPSAGGQEVSYIDLDYASGFIKCMGNYWVMFYCG